MILYGSPSALPAKELAHHQQVRLQTRAPDGPKGMFNTFLHILRNDSFLGLYNGVSFPHPPTYSQSEPTP